MGRVSPDRQDFGEMKSHSSFSSSSSSLLTGETTTPKIVTVLPWVSVGFGELNKVLVYHSLAEGLIPKPLLGLRFGFKPTLKKRV